MAYDRDLSFVYMNPTKIVFGENTAKSVGIEMSDLGCSRAVLVTDKGLREAGLVERIEQALGGKLAGTFDQCEQDSGVHIINKGAEFAKSVEADCVVSLGGGSVIDTGKGMSILIKEGGQLSDYTGFQMLTEPVTPHIVIPTTAGTGSEVTYAAVIKDWERNQKLLFCDYYIIPRVGILDPTLTAGLPPMLTATTGMDAFCHAVEAMHALQAEPISDGMAVHAIHLIMEYLPKCVEDGSDLFARGQQQIAATIAGVAFSNAQVGLVHAMAHSIGALFKVPHGMANSILLPHVMMYNLDTCADCYASVARAMGIDTSAMSDEEAGKAAADGIWELTKRMGVPQRLRDVGAPEDGLMDASVLSLSDGSIIYNPKPVFEAEEVLSVYKNAW